MGMRVLMKLFLRDPEDLKKELSEEDGVQE